MSKIVTLIVLALLFVICGKLIGIIRIRRKMKAIRQFGEDFNLGIKEHFEQQNDGGHEQ